MSIDNQFSEVQESLESSRDIFEKNSFDDDSGNLRSVSEAKLILNTLRTFALTLEKTFKEYPSLESIFEKNYGKFKNFLKRDNLVSTCLVEDYLFADAGEYPLVHGQDLDLELLTNYELSFIEWVQEVEAKHLASQKLIFQDFDQELKQSSLGCHCLKCSGDYRAKLRDSIYQDQKKMIDIAIEELENLIVEKEIIYISDYVTRLKKNLEKNIGKVRYKLKRGSLNKLDSDIKNYFKLSFGYGSELATVYQERLIVFFNSLLVEDGHSIDIITRSEYDRFFSQLGTGLWRNPNSLKKDYRKLVKSILAFKRKDISASILKEYLGEFWIHSPARRKKRKIVYHMGPTN